MSNLVPFGLLALTRSLGLVFYSILIVAEKRRRKREVGFPRRHYSESFFMKKIFCLGHFREKVDENSA